jgi:ribonuclease HI
MKREAYALYEGTMHALLKGIRRIIICGDSMILIRAIIKQNIAGSNIYKGVLTRIQALLHQFKRYTMFHIKRELNTDADQLAKEGTTLRKGEMKVNGDLKPRPIP